MLVACAQALAAVHLCKRPVGEASASLRDRGGASTNRSVATSGSPGFVTSTRLGKEHCAEVSNVPTSRVVLADDAFLFECSEDALAAVGLRATSQLEVARIVEQCSDLIAVYMLTRDADLEGGLVEYPPEGAFFLG